MSHCTHCPPPPRLAAIVKRKELPRVLRRLIGAVQAAKHAEWSALHAMHGGYSSKGAHARGASERVALHIATDSRMEWLSAITHLLAWSRS